MDDRRRRLTPVGWVLCEALERSRVLGAVFCGELAADASRAFWGFEREKGIWWMPWRQEATKDVARCENLGGAASRR